MHYVLYLALLLVTTSCTQALEEGSASSGEAVSGITYDYPNGSGYQFYPPSNQIKFNTITGGSFSVEKISVINLSSKNNVRGLTSLNGTVYLLFDNHQQFSYSYIIRSYLPNTGEFVDCIWYGDGSSYISLSNDGAKLLLRSYSSNLKVRALSLTCVDQGLQAPVTSLDSAGFSLITYHEYFGSLNNEYLVPFQNSGTTKLKVIHPATGYARDFVLQQSLGVEKMVLNNQFFTDGNVLWTVSFCQGKSNTLCLWRLETDTGKISYAYLPKEYYPLMTPNTGGAKTWLTRGDQMGHLFFNIVYESQLQVYDLSVSQFYSR